MFKGENRILKNLVGDFQRCVSRNVSFDATDGLLDSIRTEPSKLRNPINCQLYVSINKDGQNEYDLLQYDFQYTAGG